LTKTIAANNESAVNGILRKVLESPRIMASLRHFDGPASAVGLPRYMARQSRIRSSERQNHLLIFWRY
jgi:hypothetical protein